MTLRRGVGIGAITNKSNVESLSKKLSEQRLEDISKSVEMLEQGIRKFVETNKEEIRNNEFLREKIKTLAASCNVDLGAATSATGRLKPGLLSSILGDALLGGRDNSAPMRKFYDFLSSRLITTCMRERVLRGPVIPLAVVLNDLRKRYPVEEITLDDVVKSVEHLKPLNPNLFILEQRDDDHEDGGGGGEKEFVPGGDPSNFFIAFQPLSSNLLSSSSSSSSKRNHNSKLDATAGGTDAIRIVVLANELANMRRKELIEKLKKRMSDSSNNNKNSSGTSPSLVSKGISPVTRFSSPLMSNSFASASQQQQQQQLFPQSPFLPELQQEMGLLEGDQPGSVFVRLTPADVVNHLSSRSFATTSSTLITSTTKRNTQQQQQQRTQRKIWSESRARMSLKAARELCEGWWDSVDKSTWLLVVLVA